MGEVVTFYSYKGGVGRSMALANTATLLARWGYNVLMVDWDLEAPGLEFYFSDYARPSKLTSGPGVLDLLSESIESAADGIKWQDSVRKITVENAQGELNLLHSGARDNSYFRRLRELDLDSFYRKQGGFLIEKIRSEWKSHFDFVLVDSRTGITDMGGICTVQLPDYLIMMIIANTQNMEGARKVADGIRHSRQHLPFDRLGLPILPVVSRFDSTEEFRISREWIRKIAEYMEPLYEDWLPKDTPVKEFIEATKLPYIPYFSFGEKLPVDEQGTRDPSGLGYAYESLGSLIANKMEHASNLLTDRSGYVRAASELHSGDWPQGAQAKRLPLVFLVDTSASMSGTPIAELNHALGAFAREIRNSDQIGGKADIAIVAFGSNAQVVQRFTRGFEFKPPQLKSAGTTAMGAAVNLGLDLIGDRLELYRLHNIPYFKPWVILLTDGAPTDDWKKAAQRLRTEQMHQRLSFTVVGVGERVDRSLLRSISAIGTGIKLNNLRFDSLFGWLTEGIASRESSEVPVGRSGLTQVDLG